MILQWVKHILILPGTILVYIPGAILWLVAERPGAMAPAGPGQVRFWIGIALATTGLVLSTWCARLFVTAGRGTDVQLKGVEYLHGPYEPSASREERCHRSDGVECQSTARAASVEKGAGAAIWNWRRTSPLPTNWDSNR